MTAGLFLIFALYLNLSLNCFSVRYDNIDKVNVNFIFIFKLINNYIKLLVTNTINKCLFCFFIYFNPDCRIFFSYFNECSRNLIIIALCLRYDSSWINSLGKLNLAELNRIYAWAECILCSCVLELCKSTDVAGTKLINFDLFLTSDYIYMSNLFLCILFGIIDNLILCKLTGKHTEYIKTSNIRVGNCLEYISCKMVCFIVLSYYFFACCKICAFKLRSAYNGRSDKVFNRVHKEHNTESLACRTCEKRSDCLIKNTNLKTSVNFFYCKFFISKIFIKQFINAFCRNLNYHLSEVFNFNRHKFGDRTGFKLCFCRIEIFGLSCYNIDETTDFFIFIERNLNGSNTLSEMITKLAENSFIICIFIVHKVHKEHSGSTEFFNTVPSLFGTYFNTGLARYNDNGCISNICWKHFLADKIEITRCINEIDFYIFPLNRKNWWINWYMAFNLLWIIVADCISVVNLAKSFSCTWFKKTRFSYCCLTWTTVTQQNHISDFFRCVTFHIHSSLLCEPNISAFKFKISLIFSP